MSLLRKLRITAVDAAVELTSLVYLAGVEAMVFSLRLHVNNEALRHGAHPGSTRRWFLASRKALRAHLLTAAGEAVERCSFLGMTSSPSGLRFEDRIPGLDVAEMRSVINEFASFFIPCGCGRCPDFSAGLDHADVVTLLNRAKGFIDPRIATMVQKGYADAHLARAITPRRPKVVD